MFLRCMSPQTNAFLLGLVSESLMLFRKRTGKEYLDRAPFIAISWTIWRTTWISCFLLALSGLPASSTPTR
jgi:hypothetical protein